MALSDSKPRLSRQYVYCPFASLNFNLGDADVKRVALMDEAGVEPAEEDWIEAIAVSEGHEFYVSEIGPALALLVGPDRGDNVTTEDLPLGTYQCWTDSSVPSSDERIVELHGTINVVVG